MANFIVPSPWQAISPIWLGRIARKRQGTAFIGKVGSRANRDRQEGYGRHMPRHWGFAHSKPRRSLSLAVATAACSSVRERGGVDGTTATDYEHYR